MKTKQILDIKEITPTTPNFIKTPYGVIPIAELSDGVLKSIGKAWTEELLKKAQVRREDKLKNV
jgi:hypothetical protein